MNALQAIAKIRLALGIQKFEAVAELLDGTKVHVDGEFAVGQQLHVVAADGAFAPAPEGQHETKEGQLITVDAAGIITAVEEKVKAEEDIIEAEEDMKKEKKMEEEKCEDEKMEEAEVEITIAPAMVETLIEALAPLMAKVEEMEKEMKKMKADFTKFSNEPAAKPVRNNFSEVTANATLESRLKTLNSLRNK